MCDSCDPMDYIACHAPLSIEFFRLEYWEWVTISYSRGSSWPMDWTCTSCIGRRILYHWATWEAHFRDTWELFQLEETQIDQCKFRITAILGPTTSLQKWSIQPRKFAGCLQRGEFSAEEVKSCFLALRSWGLFHRSVVISLGKALFLSQSSVHIFAVWESVILLPFSRSCGKLFVTT